MVYQSFGRIDETLANLRVLRENFLNDQLIHKYYLGHYMDPSIQMVAANVSFGKKTWAQPNGKKAGVPLADTISAEQHTDKEGPTAAIKSYGKLDHAGQTNGTILNMWISRSELVAT